MVLYIILLNRIYNFRIIPRNDNLNKKALEVNQELLKMCKETKFDYIDHKIINPRAHLNKLTLHLDQNGSVIIGKSFVDMALKECLT